jgi:probable F420-dependent oxidoreductase
MRIDAFGSGLELHRAGERAKDFARAGYDGLWLAEAGRTAYLTCAATALAAPAIDVGTAVATAFPRSPMVTAQIAWELAEATGGRFVLGLGTQIKAHIERRFSTAYDHPGARLREYVLALRAIFRAFSGKERLNFKGDFYSFSLLGMWTPGPIAHPDIPIYLAAVRPWMLRAAGEVADGVHVHPFHSRRYLDEVIIPNVARGAQRAGRNPKQVKLVCPVFTIVGDTEEERAEWRQRARFQIAFYGLTPAYAGVFERHGWHGISQRLTELQRAGDIAGMANAVTDEMLAVYAITGTWDEVPKRIVEKYRGVADRIILYFATEAWEKGPQHLARWQDLIARTRSLAREGQ